MYSDDTRSIFFLVSAFIMGCFLIYEFHFINYLSLFIYAVGIVVFGYFYFKYVVVILKEQQIKVNFYSLVFFNNGLSLKIKILKYIFFLVSSIFIIKVIGLSSVLLLIVILTALPNLLKNNS